MHKELQKELIEKYPKIFADCSKTPQESNMAAGIAIGDGWFHIIDTLCGLIQGITDSDADDNQASQVVAEQIKEKFGCLRFYARGMNQQQRSYVYFAEAMSRKVCEDCGTTSQVTTEAIEGKHWIRTLCVECRING